MQAKKRFEWQEMVQSEPFFKATYKICEFEPEPKDDKEFAAILTQFEMQCFTCCICWVNRQKNSFRPSAMSLFEMLISYCATNLPIDSREKQELLAINNEKEQAYRLLMILNRESQILELKMNIQLKTREDLNQQQKNISCNSKSRLFRRSWGNTQQIEIDEFRKKAKDKNGVPKWCHLRERTPEARTTQSAIARLLGTIWLYTNHPELPWNEYSKDNFNLKNAQKILMDHFGMEKVKERIIEHLAVLKLKGDLKSPILCLYGPPGVGKRRWVNQLPKL